MLIVLDKHSGVPIFRQLMDQLKGHIWTGRLKPGDPVPSVKDLALQIAVNPMTISKAFQLLESEGFLERRRGVGMFAAKPRQHLSDDERLVALQDAATRLVVQALQLGLDLPEVQAALKKRFKELKPGKGDAHGN